jgi:hypothetical protein
MIDYLAQFGVLDWLAALAAAALFALALHIFNRTPRLREAPGGVRCALAALTVWAVAYGGSKGPSGRVTVDDPYIRDDGSWLSPSNNVAHVAIAKKSPLLPDNTAILVYARELALSNATDWVRITPHLTYADHPHDYQLPGLATNYNVMVAADFTPAPTVHTNGVWSINGFIIPGSGGKMGFKQTTTIIIQEEP